MLLLILGGTIFVAVIVLNFVTIRCANCWQQNGNFIQQFKLKHDAHVDRVDNGFQDGWRTVRENVETNTHHYDNNGRQLGRSQGSTYVNRTVPTRTYFFTDYYECPDCGIHWSVSRQRRHDL